MEQNGSYALPHHALLSPIFHRPITALHVATTNHSTPPPPHLFSVADYGAIGDGLHYDTAAIQATIDACHSAGGGQIRFPPGTYLTATVYIKSGVYLVVEEGAKILGGTKLEDYPEESRRWYVLLAENATDVGITGGGVIDGHGMKFVKRFEEAKNVMVSWNETGACLGDECRPRLVGFLGCRNVRVWNIRLNEPAYWWSSSQTCLTMAKTLLLYGSHIVSNHISRNPDHISPNLHLVGCDNTSIHDVSIYGDFNTPNNDGIDIEDSNNTVITRCSISTGDDSICPKTSNGPLYNLTVTNCWLRSRSSAIKLGSGSFYDFKGLVFDNITIDDSHRGLGMQIRDGGDVSDVTFSNMNIKTRYYEPVLWWGRAEPIYITTCPRDSNSKKVPSQTYALSHLYDLVDYRPGCRGLVKHSPAGMIMEHIDGLELENVNMRWSGVIQNKRWNNPLDFLPSTVNNISFLNFQSGSDSVREIRAPREGSIV
ncbi:hypothetical protein CK203_074464 [Vitis vinifera]|uniref:Rhamnogalacturonase A/B/Epimerase-like pectate lyase domain-containing protein n=1 Tax=Vitis vinifera TaxID=29760 RepID=A0A438EH08_VITVI|nr:hypothetical protein CK203_074464 [Vitis vinifera]